MKNNMENLEVVVKEAGLTLYKGSDLLAGKDKIDEFTNYINIETKETITLVRNSFENEEGACCYLCDIGDSYFISARQFLLTTFSNKELTNELFRRVENDITTSLDEVTTGVDINE